MLTIVVPMAGAGSRFTKVGYKDPKPLIPILGVPMIRLVIENLRPRQPHRFVFICQRAHVAAYGLRQKLEAWAPGCAIIELDGLTEGAACTVLAAEAQMPADAPLMIANSDQYVDASIDAYLADMQRRRLDGLIMTMKASDPKWSFVGLSPDGLATRVVEKEVISGDATVGIYNFAKAKDFVWAAKEMMRRNLRVNNEFYVAPTYNLLFERGYRVGVHPIGRDGQGMHGLGTPKDLEEFVRLPVATRAVEAIQ